MWVWWLWLGIVIIVLRLCSTIYIYCYQYLITMNCCRIEKGWSWLLWCLRWPKYSSYYIRIVLVVVWSTCSGVVYLLYSYICVYYDQALKELYGELSFCIKVYMYWCAMWILYIVMEGICALNGHVCFNGPVNCDVASLLVGLGASLLCMKYDEFDLLTW